MARLSALTLSKNPKRQRVNRAGPQHTSRGKGQRGMADVTNAALLLEVRHPAGEQADLADAVDYRRLGRLLGRVMLNVCIQGAKACTASFEMRPRKTLAHIRWRSMQYLQTGSSAVDMASWPHGACSTAGN